MVYNNKYRGPKLKKKNVQKVINLGKLSPKWDAYIKFFPKGLLDLKKKRRKDCKSQRGQRLLRKQDLLNIGQRHKDGKGQRWSLTPRNSVFQTQQTEAHMNSQRL